MLAHLFAPFWLPLSSFTVVNSIGSHAKHNENEFFMPDLTFSLVVLGNNKVHYRRHFFREHYNLACSSSHQAFYLFRHPNEMENFQNVKSVFIITITNRIACSSFVVFPLKFRSFVLLHPIHNNPNVVFNSKSPSTLMLYQLRTVLLVFFAKLFWVIVNIELMTHHHFLCLSAKCSILTIYGKMRGS